MRVNVIRWREKRQMNSWMSCSSRGRGESSVIVFSTTGAGCLELLKLVPSTLLFIMVSNETC